ncbi:MAG TPA: hypothetical protein VGR03_09740 [Candidatus Acidoferrum sp.]|nr:hypothetical protein [Candidatus Acidoferrum sp.]
MVTYVLGAGASRHAGYPLANELGNRLHDWVRQNWADEIIWKGYIEALHKHYGGLADLELVLTELYERPAGSRATALSTTWCGNTLGGLRVAIPEFFNSLRDRPLIGPDLYRSLARHKARNGEAILTFNYDLAVESAFRKEALWEIGDGYGFSLGVGITPTSKVKVLKLHGSTNWLGILFDGNMGFSQYSRVYGPRPTLLRESDFRYLGYSNVVRDPHCKGVSLTGGDPALVLPTLHKNFFHQTSSGREWEPFWNHIWGQAANVLHSSEKIVIIGYSIPAADERARELLLGHSNSNAEISVFSGSRTDAICEAFRKSGFRIVKSSGKGRFEDFLSN